MPPVLSYNEYITSSMWAAKRAAAFRFFGRLCMFKMRGIKCGSTDGIQVHHKHYRNLGNEAMHDLEVLCKFHHAQVDKERQAEKRRRSYMRSIETFAEKKYGEDWDCVMTLEEAQDEFESWLNSKCP